MYKKNITTLGFVPSYSQYKKYGDQPILQMMNLTRLFNIFPQYSLTRRAMHDKSIDLA